MGARSDQSEVVVVPVDEPDRLAILHGLDVLDTPNELSFDALAEAAALAFDAPIGLVSLVDADRQWFKACYGADLTQTNRDISFCTHAIEIPDDVFLVPDAKADKQFRNNPLVTGPPHVGFYAGAPIIVKGAAIGTLCILDHRARNDIGDRHIALLKKLAASVAAAMEARQLEKRTSELEQQAEVHSARMASALEAADMAVWSWDVKNGEIVDYGRIGTEVEPLRVPFEDFLKALTEEDRQIFEDERRSVRPHDDAYQFEYRDPVERDRWRLAFGRPVKRDEDGLPLLVTGINLDITERKRDEDRITAQAQEMRHRVNNLIGLADALASRTAREVDNIDDFLTSYRSRLQALARTQRMLMAGDGRARLEDLVEAVIAPFRKQDRSVISLDLPDVFVTNAATQVLTLAFHELTTNALKYGALRWPFGKVVVEGEMVDNVLKVRWAEHANAKKADVPVEDYVETVSSGRGKSIIERMMSAQGGKIMFESADEGMRVSMEMPVD
ncbi:MAG: HWE histidine kinase domain-containing protein [Pacificimonas sp.]